MTCQVCGTKKGVKVHRKDEGLCPKCGDWAGSFIFKAYMNSLFTGLVTRGFMSRREVMQALDPVKGGRNDTSATVS